MDVHSYMPVLQKLKDRLLGSVGSFPGLNFGINVLQEIQDRVTQFLIFQLDPPIFCCDSNIC